MGQIGPNPIWLVSLSKEEIWRQTRIPKATMWTWNIAIYKPRRRENRCFPHTHWKEPTLMTPWFSTSGLQNWDNKFPLVQPQGTTMYTPSSDSKLPSSEDMTALSSGGWFLSVPSTTPACLKFLSQSLLCLFVLLTPPELQSTPIHHCWLEHLAHSCSRCLRSSFHKMVPPSTWLLGHSLHWWQSCHSEAVSFHNSAATRWSTWILSSSTMELISGPVI